MVFSFFFKPKKVSQFAACLMGWEMKIRIRNKYMSCARTEADDENSGRVVNVKIKTSNQNSLFGSINNEKIRAA